MQDSHLLDEPGQALQPAQHSQFSILNSQFLDRGALVILLLFVLLLPLSTPRIYATDEVQYFAYLHSLYFDHDLDFRNEYQYFADLGLRNGDPAVNNALLRDHPNDPIVSPKTGLLRNVAPIGSAMMWAPGFAIADAGVLAARALGSHVPRDGFSWPYIWGVCIISALYSLGGLLLSYRLALRFVGAFAATLATIGIWLATPLVFYTYILMPWSHNAGLFLVALFLTLWMPPINARAAAPTDTTTEPRPRSLGRWALLGLIAGLLALTREQLAFLLIIPLVEGVAAYIRLMLMRQWRTAGRWLAGHALFLLVFLLALIPQFLVYQTLYGQPRPSTVVSGKLKLCSPHMFDTLVDLDPAPDAHQDVCGAIVGTVYRLLGRQFDSNGWYFLPGQDSLKLQPLAHGAFLWSPILIPALLGLAWLIWRGPGRSVALLLLLGLIGQVYINGTISTWHLAGSFGFRRLLECTPIFIIGLAALTAQLRGPLRHWLPIVAVVMLITWNIGLIAQWTVVRTAGGRDIRQGLVWPDMLHYQFIEVPRTVASKVDALLFDRCKLFKNCS